MTRPKTDARTEIASASVEGWRGRSCVVCGCQDEEASVFLKLAALLEIGALLS